MRMKRNAATRLLHSTMHKLLSLLIAAGLILACSSSAAAQKDKKKKKDETPTNSSKITVPLSDEQQIDYMLSEMLGAWQLGDVEKMHAKYADDVIMVNGAWAPPVIGWANYLAIYQQQRARMQQVRMERTNTYVKVSGNFGWACYQWEFSGLVDGQPVQSLGHTTVVVQKRADHWVIVHNHTSLAPGAQPLTPTNPPPAQQPAKPSELY
jgi:ketosteroid isomerase-like protein